MDLWDAETKSKFSFFLKQIDAWNVYNLIIMYITLFTNEHIKWFYLICVFSFTVDSGGSPKTENW